MILIAKGIGLLSLGNKEPINPGTSDNDYLFPYNSCLVEMTQVHIKGLGPSVL